MDGIKRALNDALRGDDDIASYLNATINNPLVPDENRRNFALHKKAHDEAPKLIKKELDEIESGKVKDYIHKIRNHEIHKNISHTTYPLTAKYLHFCL